MRLFDQANLEELDAEIESLEARLKDLKDLRRRLTRLAPPKLVIPQGKGKPKETLGKMIYALRMSGNQWMTAKDFEEKTGCAITAIRQVLYRQNVDEFERKTIGPGNSTGFRLKD